MAPKGQGQTTRSQANARLKMHQRGKLKKKKRVKCHHLPTCTAGDTEEAQTGVQFVQSQQDEFPPIPTKEERGPFPLFPSHQAMYSAAGNTGEQGSHF